MNSSGETAGSRFSFAHPWSAPMTRFSRPREIDNATLRLLLAIVRTADEAEQLAAPQIHGTELGPKTTHIAKPRQSAQSGDKCRNLYLPVNGPAIGDLWDMFNFRS